MYMIHRSSPLVTAVCMGDFGIPEGRGGGGGHFHSKVIGMLVVLFRI